MKPIQLAKRFYEEKRAKAAARGERHPCFETAVAEHWRRGIVRSSDKSFVMALPIMLPCGAAWFCACAVGDIADMVASVPENLRLPYIAFTRRGEKKARFCRLDRFMKLNLNLRRSAKHMSNAENF